jgi:ABC-type multidrug transport system ATPase subunit
MNVLCGKVSRTSGTLSISGKVAEIHQFKKLIGYVPQEDTMLRELTIRDILLHSARIRLPHTWSDKDMQEYVDVILDTLNLTHVQHVNIGDESQRGISGGQRKRVNIGIELCAIPTCLFLDEPTSGLDSTAALEVCDVLRQISHLGLTIVSVIHQPRVEIFKQFDDIFLIAPGGRTAYLGPTTECQPYFESLGYVFDLEANPADVLMDILSGKSVNPTNAYTADDLVRLWVEKEGSKVNEVMVVEAKHNEFHEVVPALIKERGANFFVQVWYCHYRSLIQQVALKNSFILEIFVGILAGVVMGVALKGRDYLYTGMLIPPMTLLSPAVFEWVIPLMSFLMGVTATLAAAPAAVKVFSEERPVYWREASAGHNKLAYFLAKNVSVIYRILICSLHFAAPLHYLSKPVISFNSMYLMIIALYFGIYGISSVISMMVERSNASLLAVIVGLFHSVSAGFGLSRKQAADAHIGWLFDICFNRWLTEILWTNSVIPFNQIYMIEEGTKYLGLTLSRVPFDFLMMFVLGVAWRAIAFVFMLFTQREKQR